MQEEQCSIHPLSCLQQFPGNAPRPGVPSPNQWAIQLHPHSMKREQPLWGRTLLTFPEVYLILQFQLQQDQHNVQAMSNN